MRTTGALLATCAAAAVVGSLLSSAPAAAEETWGPIVGMGDSYASGLGAGPYDTDSGACFRSAGSWQRSTPLPQAIAAAGIVHVACAGATTADVRSPAQLDALTPATRLVLLSVGGNDAYFTPVAKACAARASCADLPLADNGTSLLPAPLSQTWPAYVRSTVKANLAATLSDIHARAPHAAIVWTGYPRLLGRPDAAAPDKTCSAASVTGLTNLRTPAVRTLIDSFGTVLEQVQQQVADEARSTGIDVRFVSVADAFTGHSACRGDRDTDPDRWIHGLVMQGGVLSAASLHPSPAGQAAYGRVVAAALGSAVVPGPVGPVGPVDPGPSAPSAPPASAPSSSSQECVGAVAADGSSTITLRVTPGTAPQCVGATATPTQGSAVIQLRPLPS